LDGPVKNPPRSIQEGEDVPQGVLKIDPENRRVSLASSRSTTFGRLVQTHKVGQSVKGKVFRIAHLRRFA